MCSHCGVDAALVGDGAAVLAASSASAAVEATSPEVEGFMVRFRSMVPLARSPHGRAWPMQCVREARSVRIDDRRHSGVGRCDPVPGGRFGG